MVSRSARARVSRSRAGSHLFGQLCRRARTSHALYSGDANFLGSSSPAAQVARSRFRNVLGTITSTMQWQFYYTPRYTIVRALVVTGVSRGRPWS